MNSTTLGLIGGSWAARANRRHVESLPSHPRFQHYSVYPSLSPLTLTMALGPGEWTTEVNVPRRSGAIVNETEVKMSGWNRQIKEMREEVDVWRDSLKRDWHMSERENRAESYNLSQLWSFSFFFFLLRNFTPDPLTAHYPNRCWHMLHTLQC